MNILVKMSVTLFSSEPRQQHVQPVVQVGLVGRDEFTQRLEEESEHLGVGVHEHLGEDVCDPLQLGPG